MVMALGNRARRRLLAWLGALAAATGVVGCALIGGIGDLPPLADGAVGDDVTPGPDGPLPEAADVTTGDHAGDDVSTDVTTQDSGCMPGFASCGGSCMPVTNDPGNCGRCGHGCQGGACEGGVCQPFSIAKPGGTPECIVVHGGALYWLNNNGPDGMILTAAADSGPNAAYSAVVPFLDAGIGLCLAVDDTSVYWTFGDTVMSAPLAGSGLTTLAAGQVSSWGIAVNAAGVYWTDYVTAGGVYEVPLDGGTITTLASSNNAGDLAIDDTTAYWAASGSGTIMKVALDGGPPVTVFGAPGPFGVAVDSTSVYWTASSAVPSGVFSMPLSGGVSPTTLASENATGIAVDGTGVYWTDYGTGNDGTVKMRPLDGGPQVPLATSQRNPKCIVVDSTSVYWTNEFYFGNVMKVAKP
jgi:hypothetical protein